MRRLFSLTVLVAALVACGTSSSGSPSTPGSVPSTAASATASTRAPEVRSAPDFTLQLGDGGRFTLAEEERPVFLVFWAEW